MSDIFKISMDELYGTKPEGVVSLYGLTENQKDIINHLADTFHSFNANTSKPQLSEYYPILGKIVTELFK